MLDTSKRLAEQPVVSNAMRNGELSAPAAEAIASAATVAPDTAETSGRDREDVNIL